ncbi:hypothetical protein F183_A40690 [Bryobacterales bacterium F-183]|nr:hypothetical protein F183_A40690 [Bryobacterales bacterium F-183]
MRLFAFLVFACCVVAHPMGNFSVSHYTRLEMTPTGAQGVYALDLAELPSFELMQKWKVKDGLPQDVVDTQAREWISQLQFAVDGRKVAARFLDAKLVVAQGAGNMPVLRVTSRFAIDVRPGVLTFEDPNYPQSNGWKEIVIAGAGVRKASHGSDERSKALTAYPGENPENPPQDLRARVEWTGAPSASHAVIEAVPQPDAIGKAEVPAAKPEPDSMQGKLARLIEEGNLGPLAFLLAFVLGCAHAMTPGHGKTMVAAYLVGERGTAAQAVLLGLIVTVTHTLSVFALGIGMYFFAGKFAPERVTKLLEFVSGAAIAILGLWLLYRRGLELAGRTEAHGHTHDYSGSLWALGASGGIVPCPSALVLLLAAISLGRIGLGLVLLVVFSLGLAMVLIAAGLLVVSGKRFLPVDRVLPTKYLPVLSAGVITLIGVALTWAALQVKVT